MLQILPQALQAVDHFVGACPPHIHHPPLVIRPDRGVRVDAISQHMNLAAVTPGTDFDPRHELKPNEPGFLRRLTETRHRVMIRYRQAAHAGNRGLADDLSGRQESVGRGCVYVQVGVEQIRRHKNAGEEGAAPAKSTDSWRTQWTAHHTKWLRKQWL